MVKSDRGLPEPPETSTNGSVSPNHEIMATPDSDTENEDGYAGYQPLPLNPDENLSSDSEDDTENNENTAQPEDTLPPITRMEDTLVREVWSGAPPQDIAMDSSKVDEVKQMMANVTLPPSSIPEWARNIPEEAWKETLLNRIQNINHNNRQ